MRKRGEQVLQFHFRAGFLELPFLNEWIRVEHPHPEGGGQPGRSAHDQDVQRDDDEDDAGNVMAKHSQHTRELTHRKGRTQ